MVRVVSQANFNETVLENKELLDLNADEAIEETVKQFEAQGVDLTNIVKDPFYLEDKNPVYFLVSGINLSSNESKISSYVNELKILCGKGIEYKILCGNEHVYDALITKLSADISLNLKENILICLTIFFDGYPDMLDKRGCIMFLEMLGSFPAIQKLIFKLIDITCLKHERNRQMYIENNIISHFEKFLNNKPSNETLCCLLNIIPALTRDDDIRVETSNRYAHACSLSKDLLKPFCQLLKVKENDEPLVIECLISTLSSIVVNNEHCLIVDAEECVPIIINLIKKYRTNENILVNCFILLFGLAGNDDVNIKIMRLDIALEISFAINNYINNKQIVLSALKLASRLCLRKPSHGQVFFKIDFPEVLIQAMKVHKKNGSIQVAGCWCIRNMTCRNHEFRKDYLVLGTEEILNHIINEFKDYAQDAKFALIELGCHVKLDEPWTGKEGEKLSQNT